MRLNPDYFDMFKILATFKRRDVPAERLYAAVWKKTSSFITENPRAHLNLNLRGMNKKRRKNYAPSVCNARHALMPPRRFATLKPFCCNKFAPCTLRGPVLQ